MLDDLRSIFLHLLYMAGIAACVVTVVFLAALLLVIIRSAWEEFGW